MTQREFDKSPTEEVIERMADCLLKTHNTVTREEIINAWRVAQSSGTATSKGDPDWAELDWERLRSGNYRAL